MKFNDGLNSDVFDFSAELGRLTFVGLRTEPRKMDNGLVTDEIRKRVYNLLSDGRRAVVTVSIPAEVPKKTFNRGQEVVLVNPVINVMATYTYPNADVVDYITADDIVIKGEKAAPLDKKTDK